MIKKLLRHAHFWQGLTLLIADGLFFGMTDSRRVISSGLMLGFGLLVLSLYYLSLGLLAFIQLYGLSFGRHRHRLALFMTVGAAGLLALQSIGQLSLKDILVLGLLAAILYTYLGYGWLKVARD
jgi:hypothetical protein